MVADGSDVEVGGSLSLKCPLFRTFLVSYCCSTNLSGLLWPNLVICTIFPLPGILSCQQARFFGHGVTN